MISQIELTGATTFDARPCFGSTISDLKIDIFTSIYLPKAIASDVLKNDRREVKEQLASLRFYELTKRRLNTIISLLLYVNN